MQDWDDAPGAIDWPRLRAFLRDEVRATGEIPEDHRSHDHLNEQKDVSLDEGVVERWRKTFEAIKRRLEEEKGEEIVWGLVDGFLLYWDEVRFVSVVIRRYKELKESVCGLKGSDKAT